MEFTPLDVTIVPDYEVNDSEIESETDSETELKTYVNFLRHGSLNQSGTSAAKRLEEELKMTPLFSMSTKEAALKESLGDFTQYALLGHVIPMPFDEPTDDIDPVLLNTDAPWSAFICGSQGSGKSHTMSCILENCLLPEPRIGKLSKPLAGLVFHYDSMDSSHCEAAHLCSQGIPVNVLVSPSSLLTMQKKYGSIPGAEKYITVESLYLHDEHLNTERIKRLMAFGDDNEHPPLYLQTLMMILRNMGLQSQGSPFSYSDFKARLENEAFTDKQNSPLKLRLDILESFMKKRTWGKPQQTSKPKNILAGKSRTLTIIDLTDPTIDNNTACVLFDIALAIFLEKTECGKIIGLDEAHNYLHTGAASENFTNNLLKAVREQRHRAARIVVATQEPTISPKLLNLCSMTFVHGFNSPEWLATLRSHVAGAASACAEFESRGRRFLDDIVELSTGESFLFSRGALLDVVGGGVRRLGAGVRKFRTRQRVTHDGGRSVFATERVGSEEVE